MADRKEDGVRTPLEEHLVEGALYAAGKTGKVNVHFTVSTEHRELFQALVEEKVAAYAAKYGVEYLVSFSEQKPSTDTVAADMENKPFRDNGKLLFRPGGHGALIENLNDLDADVIFIKNIDNVVPDRLKDETVAYKKLIAGVLVTLQKKAFEYLELLDGGKYTHEQLEEIIKFVQTDLCCRKADIKDLEDAGVEQVEEIRINFLPCKELKEAVQKADLDLVGIYAYVGDAPGLPNSDGSIFIENFLAKIGRAHV